MTNGIFTLTYSPLAVFERFLILVIFAAALMWIYGVIRLNYSRNKAPLKVAICNSSIESALLVILFLAVYFGFFIRATGWQRFVWDEWHWSLSQNTYLMLLPEILTLIFISVYFFIQTNKLSNLLKSK